MYTEIELVRTTVYRNRARSDIRKITLSVTVHLNSLPDSVKSAKSIFTFETRLSKYRQNQEIVLYSETTIST